LNDFNAETIDALLDEFVDRSESGMPVRVMEALLETGDAAVEPLLEIVRNGWFPFDPGSARVSCSFTARGVQPLMRL
jgi:hypothetical protein